MDAFDTKNLSPMLFFEEDPFDSNDYIYELKLDGARCLAYLDNYETVLVNKREKNITNTYPELKEIHKQVKEKCILDGEIVVMYNGKPDFFKLQKRSLLTNNLKIKLLSNKFPVTFIAFDILYLNDKLIIDLPLIERKKLLGNNIIENSRITISRYIEEKGIDFFNLTKAQDLEGVVAKLKNSKYYLGKRSRVWLKFKVYQEEDVVICGYVPKDNSIKDLILGSYDKNNNIYELARVNTTKDKNIIMKFAEDFPSKPIFNSENKDIVWMKPYLIGTVKYMMKTKYGGLRQAVFKGLRDDKTIEDLNKRTFQ